MSQLLVNSIIKMEGISQVFGVETIGRKSYVPNNVPVCPTYPTSKDVLSMESHRWSFRIEKSLICGCSLLTPGKGVLLNAEQYTEVG
ncbi:hypothetical protein NPIL_251811 [Nephila pilipes]|uniref:Uncharacterized protein n=1 Tax=Nephila pilipes TaxID=299642 RepID=A0A8X6TPF4_NEPPI|nr:hypothetical protein NPIL_251811 [Nephila pilipes]